MSIGPGISDPFEVPVWIAFRGRSLMDPSARTYKGARASGYRYSYVITPSVPMSLA